MLLCIYPSIHSSDLDSVCGLYHVERAQEDPQQGLSWEKSHDDGEHAEQSPASQLCRVDPRWPPGGGAARQICSAQVVSTFLDIAGNRAAASCAGFTGWGEPSTPKSSICHFLPQHSSHEGSLLSSLHRWGDQGSERWLCCSPSHRQVVVDPEFRPHSPSSELRPFSPPHYGMGPGKQQSWTTGQHALEQRTRG